MLIDSGPGRTLKNARIEHGLTLEQAADSLRLGTRELGLLEEEDFASFTSLIYVCTYLRRYAEFLSVDPEPLIEAATAARKSATAPRPPVEQLPPGPVPTDQDVITGPIEVVPPMPVSPAIPVTFESVPRTTVAPGSGASNQTSAAWSEPVLPEAPVPMTLAADEPAVPATDQPLASLVEPLPSPDSLSPGTKRILDELRWEGRFDQPFLRRPRSRRRSGRHLAPPPVTYVAYPEPAWVRSVPPRQRGRPRSRFGPTLMVVMVTAAAALGLYLLLTPTAGGLLLDVASRATGGALGSRATPAPPPSPERLEGESSNPGATRQDPKPLAPAPPPPGTAGPADSFTAPVATVQVLNGSGDPAKLDAAVQALRAMGYQVLAAENLPDAYQSSAVLATTGHEDQGATLVGRDPRFGTVRHAPTFHIRADLHVIIGHDWPAP